MDFRALPRRDLQALCKRNGIRANMTNAAMADALAALPAVDGIEEPEKEAAAATEEEEEGEGEMQGISLPGGSGVEPTPPVVIILDDSEEDDNDLMPALGVGRRRGRPATRKRAAASMAETASEAVPARTTRARSRREVVSAPEEEAPKGRQTPRRDVSKKTSTEKEEEEKGTQGDVSDDCVVDSTVEERHADVQQFQDSPIFLKVAVSGEEIHHASEDAEMVPVVSNEAAEEVDFTKGAAEENEVPTSGGMLQSAAKAIEEKEPVASRAMSTRKRAAASMAKIVTEAAPARATRARSQRVVVSAPEEEAPKARRTSRRAVTRKTGTEQEEEEKGTQGDVSDVEAAVPAPASSDEGGDGAEEIEAAMDAQNEEQSEPVLEQSLEDKCETGVVEDVPVAYVRQMEEEPPVAEEKEPTLGVGRRRASLLTLVEPVTAPVTRKRAAATMAKRGESSVEAVPAWTTRTRLRSASKAIEQKEDMAAVEKEAVVATGEMSQRSATREEGVIGVITVDNRSQATVTDDEGIVKKGGFTADLTAVSIEEEVAVAADEMPLSLATIDESFKEEVVSIDYLSQATVTEDEGAIKESGFSCDLTDMSVEEKGVVAADGIPQGLAKLDRIAEQVVTIDNLSQVTDDEGAVKESGFSCDLADVSVEEDGVVAADEMSQRSATLDESIKEEAATIENLSQATVTDDEWVVKESGFTRDFPPVVNTARDFSDHTATKSMCIDSITVEPMVSEAADVPLRMYNNSSGQKNVTEPVAVEREKEVKAGKECEALGSLSVRKLRIKLKKVAVEREKEGKECEALGSLSLRKLRIKLKEKVAVAQENEADDVPLCMHSSSVGEKNASEPVSVKQEEEMKGDNKSEALGNLSLRKLRTKLCEKVAVAQENEVKEGKESKALDKLSLRKLKMKLKETLNAQKVISE